MRSFIVSAVAAATVIAGAAVSLPAEANAAARHHHRAHVIAPAVRQDPYRSFNQVDPPAVVPVAPVDPYSSYRWPPSGGAT